MTDKQVTELGTAYNVRINSLMGELWNVYTCTDPEASTKTNRVWDLLVAFDAEVRAAALATQPEDPRITELEADLARKAAALSETGAELHATKSECDQLAAQVVELREVLESGVDEIEMAFQANATEGGYWHRRARQALTSTESPAPQVIERIRREARQKEREACAKVLDKRVEVIVEENGHWEPDTNHTNLPEWAETACEELEEHAAAIRSRSDGEG